MRDKLLRKLDDKADVKWSELLVAGYGVWNILLGVMSKSKQCDSEVLFFCLMFLGRQ